MRTLGDGEAPPPSPSSSGREAVFPVKRFLRVCKNSAYTDFDEISRSSILNEDPNASAELRSQRVPATVHQSFVESIRFHLRNKIAFLSKVWKISFCDHSDALFISHGELFRLNLCYKENLSANNNYIPFRKHFCN